MTRKNTVYVIAALAVVCCVLVSVLWGWHKPADDAVAREQSAQTARPIQRAPEPALIPQAFEGPLVDTGVTTLVPGPMDDANVPPALAQPRTPFDLMRQRVMAANPDIAQFRHLQRKALLRSDEKEMLRNIYKDREIIDAAKKDLLAEGEVSFSKDNEFKRLYRVEYLGMGLGWKDNPEKANLLKDIEELLLAQNVRPEQDFELRRSLAGDKVELFMILLYHDRARAQALIEQVRGTSLEKLFVYSMKRYDALWALADK